MKIKLLDRTSSNWNKQVELVRKSLGAPHNQFLLPEHFLKVVLPKIGGSIVQIDEQGSPVGYGFLLPRSIVDSRRYFTMRFQRLPGAEECGGQREIVDAVSKHLQAKVVFYEPEAEHEYIESHRFVDGLDYGRPNATEAQWVRRLQQEVWHNPPDFLYPADIHSEDFDLATSIVARAEEQVAGFLFGFYKFGGDPYLPDKWKGRLNDDLRIESQTMGVASEFRGRRIGYTLKRLQANQAVDQGVDIVNWTADPLQFPNAALNFVKLRAVAYAFQPALYDIRNELNQVIASRFSLTWVVSSERVKAALEGRTQGQIVQVASASNVVRVNQGHNHLILQADSPLIAIEVPPDWSALQGHDIEVARRWRRATDSLFSHYVGKEPDQYMITAAGVDGDRRYLIGERVDNALLERLVRSDDPVRPGR